MGREQAGEFAALTHGDPAARSTAAQAAVLLQHCLDRAPGPAAPADLADRIAREALEAGIAALPSGPGRVFGDERQRLAAAFQHALDRPAEPAPLLARLAPDASAPAALLGGLYTAASFPRRDRFGAALAFASGAPDGDSVACVTGALLGAVHGAGGPARGPGEPARNWPGCSTCWLGTCWPRSRTRPAAASTSPAGTRTGGTATPAGEPIAQEAG